MSNVLSITAKHPLVGTWRCADDFTSVEFQIVATAAAFNVSATDTEDGEVAEVYDVQWNGEAMTFAVHWVSTGRFTKYKLRAVTQKSVSVDFTYSGQETWLRSTP